MASDPEKVRRDGEAGVSDDDSMNRSGVPSWVEALVDFWYLTWRQLAGPCTHPRTENPMVFGKSARESHERGKSQT